MSKKFIFFGRTHKPAGSDQVDLSSRPEERSNTEFASLRRLDNYRQNPVALAEAIERARDAAEVYRQWQESAALIRNIVLRLSGGSEIKIDKATPDNFNRFGFRFTSKFPRGSVLNFYKQADKEFREVLLYSIELDKIPASGHVHTKTYENGQTLMLEVEPGLSGQFNVSIDYTMPPDAVKVTRSRLNPLSKYLPVLARHAGLLLAALFLLVTFVILAIQKSRSIDAPTAEAAPGIQEKVDRATTIPAVPPPPPVDDQQSKPKSKPPAPDAGSDNRLSGAAIPPAVPKREVSGVAGVARASTRKPTEKPIVMVHSTEISLELGSKPVSWEFKKYQEPSGTPDGNTPPPAEASGKDKKPGGPCDEAVGFGC